MQPLPLVSPSVELLEAHRHLSALLESASTSVFRKSADLVLEIDKRGNISSERVPDKNEKFIVYKFEGHKTILSTKAAWMPGVMAVVDDVEQMLPAGDAVAAYIKFLRKGDLGSANGWTAKKSPNNKCTIAVSCANWADPDLHDSAFESGLIERDNEVEDGEAIDRFGNRMGDGTLRVAGQSVGGMLNIASCNKDMSSLGRYGKFGSDMIRVGVGTAEKCKSVFEYLWMAVDSSGHPLHRRFVSDTRILTYVVGKDQKVAPLLNIAVDGEFFDKETPHEAATNRQSASQAIGEAIHLKPSRKDSIVHVFHFHQDKRAMRILYRYEQTTSAVNERIKRWELASRKAGGKAFAPLSRWKWIYSEGKKQKPPRCSKPQHILGAFFGDYSAMLAAKEVFEDRTRQILLHAMFRNNRPGDAEYGKLAWSLVSALILLGGCMNMEKSPAFLHGKALRKLHEIHDRFHFIKHRSNARQTIAEAKLRAVYNNPSRFGEVCASPQMIGIMRWASKNDHSRVREFREIMSLYTPPKTFTRDEGMAFLSGWFNLTPLPSEGNS